MVDAVKPKDWLSEGLDTVEKVMDTVQEAYDALPSKQKTLGLLNQANSIISQEIDGSYNCQFDNVKKAIKRAASKKRLDDPDKTFKRIERAISRDVRNCFKVEYGDIL